MNWLVILWIGLLFAGMSPNIDNDLPDASSNEYDEVKKINAVTGVYEAIEQLITADLDEDGAEEVIVVYGTTFTRIFVLKQYVSGYKVLGELSGNGYGTMEVEIIKLQGSNQNYIWTRVSNTGSLNGFVIYALEGNDLEQLVYSASATGSGHDYIVDGDEDGYIDGYVQERSSYDVLYYPTNRFFELREGEFDLKQTLVDIPAYPTSPEAVVQQFLELYLLREMTNGDLKSRLEELNPEALVIELGDEGNLWEQLIKYELVPFAEVEGERAWVHVVSDRVQLNFNLVLKENRWVLTQ